VLRKRVSGKVEEESKEEIRRKIPIIQAPVNEKNQLIVLDPENPMMIIERKGRFYFHKIHRELNISSITPLK
jgi:hypothetical protein